MDFAFESKNIPHGTYVNIAYKPVIYRVKQREHLTGAKPILSDLNKYILYSLYIYLLYILIK